MALDIGVVMDGVFVAFAKSLYAEVQVFVERLGASGTVYERNGSQIFFAEYTNSEFSAEFDEIEVDAVISKLGKVPACILSVECRHGSSAKVALDFVAELMENLGDCVLIDHLDNLFSLTDVALASNDETCCGIFDLEDWGLKRESRPNV